MITKKNIYLYFFIFSFLGYSQKNELFENKVFPLNIDLPLMYDMVENNIPREINIFFMKENIEVPILKVISKKGKAFLHGKKLISKSFTLFLYSTTVNDKTTGYILTSKSNCLTSYIKVFEDTDDGPFFLKSYLVDNKIITVSIYDQGFDVEDGTDDSEHSYSVVHYNKQGKLTTLNKKESIITLNLYKKMLNLKF